MIGRRKDKNPEIKTYREVSRLVLGVSFSSYHKFISDSMSWLADKYGDLHVEYHKDSGWQVSTCYADGEWGDDSWLTGDGTLEGCLLKAVTVATGMEVSTDGGR